MLDFWAHAYTEIVTENPELTALPPEKRLLDTTNMIRGHDLARYDLPVRAWAQTDPSGDNETALDAVLPTRRTAVEVESVRTENRGHAYGSARRSRPSW